MNWKLLREYGAALTDIGKDTSFRAVIVSANGKYFSVGLDLNDSENTLIRQQ